MFMVDDLVLSERSCEHPSGYLLSFERNGGVRRYETAFDQADQVLSIYQPFFIA
jgi:hypothetical protein